MGELTIAALLGGGIDSFSCAYFLKKRGHDIHGVFVDYGQVAAVQEKKAAISVASYIGVPIRCMTVNGGRDVFDGEIQGRNAALVSLTLLSEANNTCAIASGIHAGTPYFDCSVAFVKSLSSLVQSMTDGRVQFFTPFLNWSKLDIYNYALKNDLPINITYSCEAGEVTPCGKCLSCKDREALGCL